MSEELMHYGILGMKWGVRRTPEQLGHKPKSGTISSETNKLYTKKAGRRSNEY